MERFLLFVAVMVTIVGGCLVMLLADANTFEEMRQAMIPASAFTLWASLTIGLVIAVDLWQRRMK